MKDFAMKQYSLNLSGRVKNFSLPRNKPLMPLYEALVNSIHAINARRNNDAGFSNGKIEIVVIRKDQLDKLDKTEIPAVESFKIIDNGIGFTERNMQSFLESDSSYKAELGGKGVGRFSWLKAFSSVHISSIYCEDSTFHKREFDFSLDNRFIEDTLSKSDSNAQQTTVELNSYKDEYVKDVPKNLETIAVRIMQHHLVYLLDNNCPEIIIKDNDDEITINQLFQERVKVSDSIEKFIIQDREFQLLHVKNEDKTFSGNRLYLCANNRLVDSKNLDDIIVNLDGQIFDKKGYWYIGILTGQYFDDNVGMNRLSFDIPENEINLFFNIPIEKILVESKLRIEKYLDEYLSVVAVEKKNQIEKFIKNTAPQYRPLLKYMPDEIAKVKPGLSAEKLEDALYSIRRKYEINLKLKQQQLLIATDKMNMPKEKYESFFKQQIKEISDVNSATLAEYVIRRKIIITLLKKGLRLQDDDKFNKESYLHNLIYPMRATSDETDHEAHNLWLIDEKLSYCNFISSDIPFDNDPKQERADILILDRPIAVSESKNDGTIFDTIIIFELKRPMRNDYTHENNPIAQLHSYVRKIRANEAKDKYHRPIIVNASTKFYLYAVCDITPKLTPFIEDNGFAKTPDDLGYYTFNKNYNAYFEILSYDKILNDAEKRNRILFDKLGILSNNEP